MKTRYALLLGTLLTFACGTSDEDDDTGIRPARDGGVRDGGDGARDGGDGTARDAGTGDRDAGPRDAGNNNTGPINAPFDTWTWVDVPDSRCMNNTPTGFGVNIHENATKLIIYMSGGNACFNDASCFQTWNRDGYGEAKFNGDVRDFLGSSIFNRNAQENYFADWSHVWIPYCSGDVYSGTSGQTTVQSGNYYFNGWNNVGLFLERIVPTFPNVDQVVISGFSAGGFGAMVNFERTQLAFGNTVDVTLIDDSGPPMGKNFMAPCLQQHWRDTWGMDAGFLSTCNNCIDQDGSFVEGYLSHLETTYPNNRLGLISSDGDEVIRLFYGFGLSNCANLFGFGGNYTAGMFRQGLLDLRDNLVSSDNFKLYMPTSTRHVWSNSNLWTVDHFGVNMQDWMVDAIEDEATWNHVPAP